MNIRNLKVAVRLFLRYGTVAVIRLSEIIASRKEAP